MTFRLLPHTADVKVAIEADAEAGLLQAAVDVVRTLLVGDCAVSATELRTIEVDGDDEAERFVRFVRELLYHADVDGFLPARLACVAPRRVSGETFDGARHVVEHGVKAVTRHQYRFDRDERGYHVEMVFDL